MALRSSIVVESIAPFLQSLPFIVAACNRDGEARVCGLDLESRELATQEFNLGSGGLNEVLESFYWRPLHLETKMAGAKPANQSNVGTAGTLGVPDLAHQSRIFHCGSTH